MTKMKKKPIIRRVKVKPTKKPRIRTLTWKRENTLKGVVPNKPGVYQMLDKNGRVIYVGHARRLRHRVQAYRQKDDFNEHPTKKTLVKKISKFRFKVMPKKKAQEWEKKTKKGKRYNFL